MISLCLQNCRETLPAANCVVNIAECLEICTITYDFFIEFFEKSIIIKKDVK